MMRSSPVLLLDRPLLDALRHDLTEADWRVGTVQSMVSPAANRALSADQLTPASVELEGNNSPAALLTKLFILAEALTPQECQDAFPSLTPDGAVQLGLVQRTGEGNFCAQVDLRPHAATLPLASGRSVEENWWVASDLAQAQTGEPPSEDYVLGIASASTTLLGLTVRRKVESALDVGCGSGILALYLATHASRVVATDVSERACMFTRFNAYLNQVDIDVRQGSLFEPVREETFDLITSNPPFVITPQAVRARTNLEYRDGMMERDSLIPLILQEGLGHLAPGGTLQMLANWEVGAEPWQARPEAWVERASAPLLEEGLSVRAWVVQRDLVDVPTYATWWMRDAHGDGADRDSWNAELREWITDFDVVGTKQVGLGSINVSVTQGAEGLVVVSEYLPEGAAPDGEAALTALTSLVLPKQWASIPLERGEDVREVRYYRPGEPNPELIVLTQGRAGGRERQVSSAVAALVGVADGELSAGQVMPAIAALLGKESEEIVAEVRAALPELLRSGTLRFTAEA